MYFFRVDTIEKKSLGKNFSNKKRFLAGIGTLKGLFPDFRSSMKFFE